MARFGRRQVQRFQGLYGLLATNNRYFVGSGTNWSSTTSWAYTSGGSPGAPVPIAGNDVYLDANSPGNLTVDVITAAIRSINCTGFTHTLTINASTQLVLGGASAGNLTFSTTMTVAAGSATTSFIIFQHTVSGNSFDFAGLSLPCAVAFNGVGGVWTQANANSVATPFQTLSTVIVFLTVGVLNTNGYACSWGQFQSSNTNVRTLSPGGSSIALTGSGASWNMQTQTNFVLSTNTATLTVTGGNEFRYAGNMNGTSVVINTNQASYQFDSAFTAANLTLTGPASKAFFVSLLGTTTVTGTFTANGNSVTNRLLVQSNTIGTSRIISAATVSLTNVDFMDITGAGTATWTGTSLGDCLGNSGITFDASVAQTWSGNTTGNWSTAANWTSRVPLPQDDVTISGLTTGTVTMDMPRACRSLTLAGSTGGAIATSVSPYIFGSLTWATGVLNSGFNSFSFGGRSALTLTSAGVGWSNNLWFRGPGSTYTMQDDIPVVSGVNIWVDYGTFATGGHNIRAKIITNNLAASGTVNGGGAGTWTLIGTGTPINGTNVVYTNMTGTTIVFADTSVSSKTFIGGNRTYGTFQITAGGTGAVIITGSNTFAAIVCAGPKTITFTSGTTQIISSAAGWQVKGTSGNVVTVNASTPGAQATISIASGMVVSNFLSLQDSNATGGAAFWAGGSSTSVSNNTGWTFGPVLYASSLSVSQGTTPVATKAVAETKSVSQSQSPVNNRLLILSKSFIFSNGTSATIAEIASRQRAMLASQGISANIGRLVSHNMSIGQSQTIGINKALSSTLKASQAETSLLGKTPLVIKKANQGQTASLAHITALLRILSISVSESISVSKQISRTVSLTQGQTPTVGRGQVAPRTLSTSQAQNVTLTVRKSKVLVFSVAVAQSPTVSRQALKTISLGSSTTVTVNKIDKRTILISQSTTGAISKALTRPLFVSVSETITVSRSLSANRTVNQATNAIRSVNVSRRITSNVPTSALLTRSTAAIRTLSVNQTQASALAKSLSFIKSVTQANTITIVKRDNKILVGSQGSLLNRKVQVGKNFVPAQSNTITLAKRVSITKTIAESTGISIIRQFVRTLALSQAAIETRSVALNRPFILTQSTNPITIRRISKTLNRTQPSTIILNKLPVHIRVLTVSAPTTVSVAKTNTKSLYLTEPTTISVTRSSGRTIKTTQSVNVFKQAIISKTIIASEPITVNNFYIGVKTFKIAQGTLPRINQSTYHNFLISQAVPPRLTHQGSHMLTTSITSFVSVSFYKPMAFIIEVLDPDQIVQVNSLDKFFVTPGSDSLTAETLTDRLIV